MTCTDAYKEYIMYMFYGFCKVVIRNTAIPVSDMEDSITIKSIKPEVESLLKKGKLKMSICDKPNSKNQKYIAVKDKDMD